MTENLTIGYVLLAFALAVGGGRSGRLWGRRTGGCARSSALERGRCWGSRFLRFCRNASRTLRWWGLLLALGTGYALFALVTKYIYHVCPACAASHFDEATAHRFSEIASAMMLALAIHCTADGLALAAGHEAETVHAPGARVLNLSLVLAVCVHKVPEGLALGALLLGAGFKRAQTVLRVAAVESTTLLGGVLGWLFLQKVSGFWLDGVVAHVGGGFVFLAAHAVLGELFKEHKGLVLAFFGLGFGTVGALTLLLRLF